MGATLESSSHLVHHGVGKLVRVGTRGETLTLFFRQKLPKTSLSPFASLRMARLDAKFPRGFGELADDSSDYDGTTPLFSSTTCEQ